MKPLKAFTLIEVVLVMAVAAIIGVSSVAAVVSYHLTTVLDSELTELVSNMQLARQNAIGNTSSSDYSIKFLPDRYVLFIGNTYDANNPNNRSFELDSLVIVSTTFANDLLSFNNFDGRVANPGSITISAGGTNRTVTVNSLGIVEDVQ